MEQNGSELNGTERKATCFYPYLPPSLYLFLGFPFHSASLRFVIPDNDILSHFISLPPSHSTSLLFRSVPFRFSIKFYTNTFPVYLSASLPFYLLTILFISHFISLPPSLSISFLCPYYSVPFRSVFSPSLYRKTLCPSQQKDKIKPQNFY